MRLIIALCLVMFVSAPAFADAVVIADHAGSAVAVGPAAVAPAVVALPDPVAAPVESVSFLWKLYKAGHLVPALVVFAFFLLTLLQKWVPWFVTGYRKLLTASALAAVAMLAERAAAGETPNATMLMGAFGVALALYVKGGESKS